MRDKKRQRVCYYTMGHPLVSSNIGGVEMQLYLIGKELQRYGWEPHYIMDSNGGEGVETVDGQHIHMVESYKKQLGGYPYMALNALFMNSNPNFGRVFAKVNPDVYHQEGANVMTGYFAHYAHKARKPFVFTIADISDCTLKGVMWHGFLKKAIKKRLYLYGLKRADVIVSIADYLTDAIRKLMPDADIRDIPQGHPVPSGKIRKAEPPYALWVSRAVDYKRPDIFLKLAKELPQYRFVMIGGDMLEEYMKKMGGPSEFKNVEFHGFVPPEKTNEYMAKASVFVDTSASTGFSNTFIQAWLRQTPVVSLTVDPDGLIRKYKLGMHSDGFEQLKEDVRLLMENGALRKKLGDSAFRFASKRYDIRNTGKAHKKLYEELLCN